MLKLDNAKINKELKGIMAEFSKNYEELRKQSEEGYKNSLQPGQTFISQEGFYRDHERAVFQTIGSELRAKAGEILNKVSLDITAEEVKAPSTDAVNVINLINARGENVSEDEIDMLMTAYGHDCPMIYTALYEKAKSLGYRDFKPHPVKEAAEKVKELSGTLHRSFNTYDAERQNMTINAATFNQIVDAVFPAEE